MPELTWLTINTSQLSDNIRLLSQQSGKPVIASIKANAYGHGLEIAAKAFLAGGAAGLAVARLEEADALRKSGHDAKILILGGLLPEGMKAAAAAGYEFFVWTPAHVAALREIASTSKPKIHIKVDTGMGRLGCRAEEMINIAKELRDIPQLELEGMATHFASADATEPADTQAQIAAFNQAITALTAAGLRPRTIHASNSAGLLRFPQARYDMARAGIAAYGIEPGPGRTLPEGVKAALSWHARIVDIKTLPPGHSVSYGAAYKTGRAQKIAVIAAGYGDGFRRILNANTVAVQGQEHKVLGQICMDQCMIDGEGLDENNIGGEVALLGEHLSASQLARRWGTIPYEVLTGIAARVPRVPN
ncbi:MAG: alanine racemase [Bdellovibrionales bacterium]